MRKLHNGILPANDQLCGKLPVTGWLSLGFFLAGVITGPVALAAEPVDTTLATVVMNQADKNVSYNFIVGSSAATVVIPPHSMQTLVY